MRPPERIGRYRIQSVVGAGGFAVVFRAHDEALDDAVAIKVLADNWVADADIRERFLEEARLMRRIRNDHVVTVHDVGELDGGQPYFVMEFAKRGSLADRVAARNGAGLDPASGRSLVGALAEGIGALHRAGVVHRDVNPRNLFLQAQDPASTRDGRAARTTELRQGLLARDERVLVGDLGLAKDVVRAGGTASLVGGTPRYQAPEQLDPSAPVRLAADVYAATGVLWEAITGSPPPLPAELGSALAAVDARWHPVFERGLAADPDERFETMAAWRDAVLTVLGPAADAVPAHPAALVTTGPYKGLEPFQPEDATRFFGRDALVGQLLDRLARERTLVVGGPSGSGKSSVVRAGLIPAVAAGGLPGSERWPVALLTPRSDPGGELAYQLLKAGRAVTQRPAVPDDPALTLRDPLEARYLAETVTDRTGGLLVVIDQFEELFTQTGGHDERQAFLDLLAGMVDPVDSRVRLVLAMRADFYATSALYPWLAERISRNQVLVGPMTRSELQEAIEEPARLAGLRLEDGLVDVVLDDGGGEPGVLPLVSHALAETWRRRRGATLTVAGYREAGGVTGALAQTAEAVYEERFDDAERRAAQRLLLRLISPGEGTPDTRRPLTLEELDSDPDPGVLGAVVQELTDARLLILDRDTIDLAHEALIHSWPRLTGWIDERRDDLRMRQRIDRAGAEWVAQGRDPDLLYRGTPLQAALEWTSEHGDELSPAGRELVHTSRDAWVEAEARQARAERRSRRIRRAAVTALSALAVVAVGASVLAFTALNQAQGRFAQSLATQAANLVEENPRLALALAVESVERGGDWSPEARSALVGGSRALEMSSYAPTGAVAHVGDALSVALRADGGVVATGNRNGTVRLWDSATGGELGSVLEGHAGAVQSLAFTPDGRWLVTAGDDGTVRRWDVGDPSAVPAGELLGSADGIVWSVAVSPDGGSAASASADGTVRLWDLEGAAGGAPLGESSLGYDRVAFSPDGDLLIAVSNRGEVLGWSVPDGDHALGPIEVHDGPVWGLAFHPSGELFATASADGQLRVWDTAAGELVAEPWQDVRGPQFSIDGELLLAGDADGRLRIWSVSEGRGLPAADVGHDARILASALAADGDVLATLGFDHTVRFWSGSRHPLGLALDQHDDGAFGLALSPDGQRLATGDGAGTVRVFATRTGELLHGPLPVHDAAVWALDFDADGARLASGAADGTVAVSDLDTGAVAARPAGHDGAVAVVRFARDQLLTGGDDGVVRRWSAGGDAVGEPLGPHRGGVTDMVLGPERTLAVSDREGNVSVWRLDDGARASTSIPQDGNTLWGLDWSPDRTLLGAASADEHVLLWSIGDGSRVANLTPHPGGATGVRFLADGVSAVTSSRDGTVRLWDVASGRMLGAAITAHEDAVWRVAAHPDAGLFATSSADGTVRVWDVLDLERACERAEGAFDAEQQRRYLGEGERAAGCS